MGDSRSNSGLEKLLKNQKCLAGIHPRAAAEMAPLSSHPPAACHSGMKGWATEIYTARRPGRQVERSTGQFLVAILCGWVLLTLVDSQ